MDKEFLYEDITKKIIKCFYKVYDELGSGFLESVYEKALMNDRIKRYWIKS
jgi:GxxExxY protein